MSPQLAEMFHLLSAREVSLCHLKKAQQRAKQLRPDVSISKLNPVEMLNLSQLFTSEYLISVVSLLEFSLFVLAQEKVMLVYSLNDSHFHKLEHLFFYSTVQRYISGYIICSEN